MKRYKLSLYWKFFMVILLVVLPSLAIIFELAAIQYKELIIDQVHGKAKTIAMQIIMTRQWVSDCGGIMVSRESNGVKNFKYFYDDRLRTPRGDYQKFTPAMVTKKLSEYSLEQYKYKFRLVSLHPVNPENRPDDFEKRALHRFENKELTEASRINTKDGFEYFQYTVPLYMEKTCIGCHMKHHSTKNIGGALSIFIPFKEIKSSLGRNHLKLAVPGIVLLLLTIITLLYMLRRVVITPLKKLEAVAGEISEGNLDIRINLSTGDEFEKLGDTFNFMAERLSQQHNFLEEKIRRATRELTDANRKLQTVDKMKSDFLTTISHELRTPLTTIRGGTDYLNRTLKIASNRSYLAIIDKNLTRLIRLVSDLFDFSRIESHKVEWSFERENLSNLVKEVVEIISPLATDKNININFECYADIYADIDLERIEQVLVNLIENGIKFSGEGTEITIKVKDKLDAVLVEINDQGIGISKENLDIVFEKFRTLPSSQSSQKIESTGLGLAISKEIVHAHGGKIWVESDRGKGSSFFFMLPKQHS